MHLRYLIIAALLVGTIHSSWAQIGRSKAEIIRQHGQNYEFGRLDDGTPYIYYDRQETTEQSGTYVSTKAYYFFEADDGRQLCYKTVLLEPASETNAWVKTLNEDLVKIGYLEWKDYETNIFYKIEVEDGICALLVQYDFDER